MRKTFDELIHEIRSSTDHFADQDFYADDIEKLLLLVRKQTLEECAKVCSQVQDSSTYTGWINESNFIDLPKDSIEIFEHA